MKKALVTSCNKNFLEGARALLAGVKRFHPDVRCYCFVPESELSYIVPRLECMAEVMPPPRKIKGVPDKLQINVGRLFASYPEEDVSVYMDADTLMCKPCPEWWDVCNDLVSAVPDTSYVVANNLGGADRTTFEKQFPLIAGTKGFNAGVFALSPAQWKDLPEQFEFILKSGCYNYSYILDQPLLNALMLKKVKWLPFRFNAHCLFDNHIPIDVRVLHFTSSPKPWMGNFPRHEPAYWYWLKYGLPRKSLFRLLLPALWVGLNSPKRWLGWIVRRSC